MTPRHRPGADGEPVAVDRQVTALDRVARRLGYGESGELFRKSARSVQLALERELPRNGEALRRAFLYLSHHGSATCTDADPHCTVCPLLSECPEGARRHGPGARVPRVKPGT